MYIMYVSYISTLMDLGHFLAAPNIQSSLSFSMYCAVPAARSRKNAMSFKRKNGAL